MTLTTLILLVIVALIPLIVIALYNSIIGGFNRVQRAWADVLTYERQKAKTLDALQEQAAQYKDFEHGLLTEVTRLRSAIAELPAQADGDALAKTGQATRALLSGLRVALEAYPELKASEIVNNLMREITEQQENVAAAIVIFNSEVELFNNSIQMFPGSLINGVMNKRSPITPFTDTEAGGSFSYKPNF